MTTEEYAQHFTPLEAVDLAYDLIERLYGPLRAPRLIDPACGEGAFLLRAIERGLTSPARAFGIERDPALACRVFGRPGGPRTAVADALLGLVAPGSFDLVVANPPYGTGAAGLREMSAEVARRLAGAYGLWGLPKNSRGKASAARLRSYPAELLFLELCVSLARPGGHVAIVLPEGICANARYASAREWLLGNLQVDAVVGLPKSTFRRTGAAAKTVLLLLTRRRPPAGHRILLGEVGEWISDRHHFRSANPRVRAPKMVPVTYPLPHLAEQNAVPGWRSAAGEQQQHGLRGGAGAAEGALRQADHRIDL